MTEHRSPIGRLFGAVVPMAVDAVDVDDLVGQLDVDALMERVDVDALLTRIDIDALLTRIDIDALLQRIDIEALMGRIDLNGLVGRIDLNELVGQVDLNVLLAGVDLNALLEDVDIKAIVAKAGIDEIVAEASTGMFARTLDLIRRQLVGLDVIILSGVDRLMRRGRQALPPVAGASATGRPAGPVSRLLAFGIDLALVSAIFSVVVYFGRAMVELFTGDAIKLTDQAGLAYAAGYFLWFGAYLWTSMEIAGRTPGKAFVGLRVVNLRGGPIGPGRAFWRTVAFPFSFILGLGFIPGVLRRDRRAFHELVAGCHEIVDWGDRSAALPSALEGWIERQRVVREAQDAAGGSLIEIAPVEPATIEADVVVAPATEATGATEPAAVGDEAAARSAASDVPDVTDPPVDPAQGEPVPDVNDPAEEADLTGVPDVTDPSEPPATDVPDVTDPAKQNGASSNGSSPASTADEGDYWAS